MFLPPLRRALLTVHVGVSVSWMGAVVAYLALNGAALTSSDEQVVRAAHLMMWPVAAYALMPLAAATVVTGVVQSLVTPWGLFRHYWVIITLVLTVLATAVLAAHLPTIAVLADQARDPASDVDALSGDLPHSIGGLVLLVVPLALNVFKPRGLTRYGWRRTQSAA